MEPPSGTVLDRPYGYRLVFRWEASDSVATSDRLRRAGFTVSDEGIVLFPSLRMEVVGDDRVVDALVRLPDDDASARTPSLPSVHPNGVADVIAVAWATVDPGRYMNGEGTGLWGPAPDDPFLGAFAFRLAGPGNGVVPLLLEPNTEGRLAATLARHGEGPVGFYLRAGGGGLAAVTEAARARGGTVSPALDGPLGRSVLLGGGGASGPHLIVVQDSRP